MNSLVSGIEKTAAVEKRDAQQETPRPPEGRTQTRPEAAAATSPEQVEKAIESTSDRIAFGNRTIQFSYDRDEDRVIVTVKDKDSGEIVRQLPPKDYLKFAARFKEMLGVLFDEQI